MLPGGAKIDADQLDEKALPHIEAIIYSMTPEERAKPSIINPKRKRRIAAGSGPHGGGSQQAAAPVRDDAEDDEAGQAQPQRLYAPHGQYPRPARDAVNAR